MLPSHLRHNGNEGSMGMTIGTLILNVVLVAAAVAGIVGLLAWSVVASMNRSLHESMQSRRDRLEADAIDAILAETARGFTCYLPATDMDEVKHVGHVRL
jgi:hypothetical protein